MTPMPRIRLAAIRAPGIQYATEPENKAKGLGGSIGGKISKRGASVILSCAKTAYVSHFVCSSVADNVVSIALEAPRSTE